MIYDVGSRDNVQVQALQEIVPLPACPTSKMIHMASKQSDCSRYLPPALDTRIVTTQLVP
jgi:hypothetical protein